MIKFRRGKTATWYKQKTVLEDGQPGYDKETNKLKIGDGKSSWSNLSSVSGLSADEILSSETVAYNRRKSLKTILTNILTGDLTSILKRESPAVITYGTSAPDTNTVGQIYLQHYDTEPEVDYIVSQGYNKGWYFQKWKSGVARCWTTIELTTAITDPYGYAFEENTEMTVISYPFTFKSGLPSEIATVHSPGGTVWLSSKQANTTTGSAKYGLISMTKQNSATYKITISVEGYWR